MASRFQAVPLRASPTYSDAVAWSNENMVAIASGHLVTILNPAMPCGPSGLITIPTSKPFSTGVIHRKDLLTGCMLPTCLSRDGRPCVRSISWSPLGLAPNAGCLLAVCTTEGVIKVYRSPFCDFSAEWVEVMDISEMLHSYFAKIGYGKGDFPSSKDEGQNDDRQNAICAEEYAWRNAMVSSVVVAWSPMFDSKSSRRRCCILTIGAKSGRISFWKVHEPQCYSVLQQSKPPVASLIGLIQAHNSWVTAISWSKFVSDGSLQLLLSTGSSDGSVKVWRGYTDDLLKSTEDCCHASFSLLEEVISAGSGLASVLALTVTNTSPHKIILAVGKGSGSIQVTGLAWAYDGRCLYSSSQDNSFRNWIVKGGSLHEVPLPSNILGVKISHDVPRASDACFGIAVSPANLVTAVVRSFDVNLLNRMYHRSLKAGVEFFWIGGQKLQDDEISDDENFSDFPNMDLVCWEHNILWSLNQYENLDTPMVLWDIIAALSAFKKYEVDFVEKILVKWLILNLGFEWRGPSLGIIPPHVFKCLHNLTSRQLQLINVINRHLILTEPKLDNLNDEEQREEPKPWIMLLEMCEKEVRERIIGCSFSATLNKYNNNNNCQPVGLAQMRRWVANNDHMVKDYVKLLASKVDEKIGKRYVAEEECSYCSARVPFEDTEVAFCSAEDQKEKHKLLRCAVSMTVCPLSPLWFCVSCKRWVSQLAPESLFTLLSYPPTNVHSETLLHNGSSSLQNAEILSKTLCPFCGILLQRLQPQFLQSTSPI